MDDSAEAREALRFALEEARLRQVPMRAVHTWQFGYLGARGVDGSRPVVGGEVDELRRAAETAVDSTLRQAIPDADEVHIERRVVEGAPAAILVEESRSRSARGRFSRSRGFAQLLLGSAGRRGAGWI